MKGHLQEILKKLTERIQDLLNIEESSEITPGLKAWVGPMNQKGWTVGCGCDWGGENNKPALNKLSMEGLQNMQQNMALAAADMGLWYQRKTCSSGMKSSNRVVLTGKAQTQLEKC